VDLQHRRFGDQLVGQKKMAPSNQEARRKTAMTNKILQLVQVSTNVSKDLDSGYIICLGAVGVSHTPDYHNKVAALYVKDKYKTGKLVVKVL
jgi:hypothetical protein